MDRHLGAERHRVACRPYPGAQRPALRQVHVVGHQPDDLAGADASLDHQPHDRLVAAVDESLALARLDQPGALLVAPTDR